MSVRSKEELIQSIAEENQLKLHGFSPLSGGDINEVFLLETGSENYVLKVNNSSRFPGMFDAEKFGLGKLLQPQVIDVPKPIATGEIGQNSYLLLEYKEAGSKKPDFWEDFGNKMAELHKVSANHFGLEKDNYIGSLPQYNEQRDSAAEFYIDMRLRPQIEMAEKKGFSLNISEVFFSNIRDLIPDEAPALVHGDLWNGNYLVNQKGEACLIDPAVAFAPREMDLGMMKLFGGFDNKLFETYNEIFPLEDGFSERIPLWQLYYLLVHLNIFGAGYKNQVTTIIRRYS